MKLKDQLMPGYYFGVAADGDDSFAKADDGNGLEKIGLASPFQKTVVVAF